MDTKGKFADEYIGLVKCNLNKSPCIYQRPTTKEIQELCDEKGIEQQYIEKVMNIFNNIEGSSGGAAAEEDSPSFSSSQSTSESSSSNSSDDESLSPSQYVSRTGYTQTQQKNYVDRLLLALALGAGGVAISVGVTSVATTQDYLVSQGLMDPLCKGPLDRIAREAARQLEPALAGPSCEDRLKRAEAMMTWAKGVIGTTYTGFSWANWEMFRNLLKDRIFEPMDQQKRVTKNIKKKRQKARTKRRAKKAAKKAAKKSAKRKSRSRKPPSPGGPSGSMSRPKSKSSSKSRSKSSSKSRSRSGSRKR